MPSYALHSCIRFVWSKVSVATHNIERRVSPVKTIAIAAAASALLFVGVPTAHADVYIGPLDIVDIGNWCGANASYPTRAEASGPFASPGTTFQCHSSGQPWGPDINVNMDAVCVQKYQGNYPNARNLYAKQGGPGAPFNAFGWGCWNP
jgi:hypothetical protein